MPPVALVSPKDTLLNYTGGNLIWAFDEHIQPIQKSNISIIPSAALTIDQHGRSLIVAVDNMVDDVAYNLSISDAVKDNNEGNVFPPQSLWITASDTLTNHTISFSITILPPNKDRANFMSSVRCDNPTLLYPLVDNKRYGASLNHLQANFNYYYTWHWDSNSNGMVDSSERGNRTNLRFGDNNETIIHSTPRKPIQIDSLNKDCFIIYPKPAKHTWDSIANTYQFGFSTYTWGHDTVYACKENPAPLFSADSTQQVFIASMDGSFTSDSSHAIVLVSDTSKGATTTLHELSISPNNIDTFSDQLRGLFFVSFSLPSDSSVVIDGLSIDVFTNNGTRLLSTFYNKGTIYSFYGEPSYAIIYSSQAEEGVMFYVDEISAKRDFLVTHRLISTTNKSFIND